MLVHRGGEAGCKVPKGYNQVALDAFALGAAGGEQLQEFRHFLPAKGFTGGHQLGQRECTHAVQQGIGREMVGLVQNAYNEPSEGRYEGVWGKEEFSLANLGKKVCQALFKGG